MGRKCPEDSDVQAQDQGLKFIRAPEVNPQNPQKVTDWGKRKPAEAGAWGAV
jgi:hypothetical protein